MSTKGEESIITADLTAENMTEEQRKYLVEILAEQDCHKFITEQNRNAENIIEDIKENKDKLAEEEYKTLVKEWEKQHPGQKIPQDVVTKYINGILAKQEDDYYNRIHATKICKIWGGGDQNYCIALQHEACKRAEKSVGYDIMPDIGFGCASAQAKFSKQNIGKSYNKISDCYDPITNKVKLNEDGTPKLKDGDLMLFVDKDDRQAFHCVRINVDDNGKVSYTAGNGDAIKGNLRWWNRQGHACYVIPTSEVAMSNAETHYMGMSNEALLKLAQQRNIVPQTNGIYAQQTSPQDYEENVSTIMASGHSKIQDRIAAFRERRDKESIARAGIVESMRADNLRLQQKREMLAEMTGTRPSSPQYNFVDRHYNCEDVVVRNQEQETPQTPVRQSFIGRLRDVFSSQRA
ncbi:MAG: hypothetical protein IJZ59_01930 [Alphaproteobacteria bacterium]|nr:hypothetical protein [Alphaproteobacteria bacterium]